MKQHIQGMKIAALASTLAILLFCSGLAARPSTRDLNCTAAASAYTRTTLYFGLAQKHGMVSEADWQAFLLEQVTPRFPTGLTVWEALGQWQQPDGAIVREPAKVLLLIQRDTSGGRDAVREIINRYKQRFQQDSVLWETTAVCAAF
jgi:hypothetical protein